MVSRFGGRARYNGRVVSVQDGDGGTATVAEHPGARNATQDAVDPRLPLATVAELFAHVGAGPWEPA